MNFPAQGISISDSAPTESPCARPSKSPLWARGERSMKISRILTGLVPALAMLLTMSHPMVKAADDMPPAIGAAAPDFTLNSQEKGEKVSLHNYKGQWVVLYFYPKDMTPGCTIEAHNFQRDQKEYDTRKAV